ncbi:unnamed protein product [Sphagnum tenellum]
MSNRAVKVQSFDAKDPFAGLALVTKPVPKAEAGHVVVQITLRPVNPIDLNCFTFMQLDSEFGSLLASFDTNVFPFAFGYGR